MNIKDCLNVVTEACGSIGDTIEEIADIFYEYHEDVFERFASLGDVRPNIIGSFSAEMLIYFSKYQSPMKHYHSEEALELIQQQLIDYESMLQKATAS
jgi:hypothetical protein